MSHYTHSKTNLISIVTCSRRNTHRKYNFIHCSGKNWSERRRCAIAYKRGGKWHFKRLYGRYSQRTVLTICQWSFGHSKIFLFVFCQCLCVWLNGVFLHFSSFFCQFYQLPPSKKISGQEKIFHFFFLKTCVCQIPTLSPVSLDG